jgi:choline dehydrogenase-like flavoprotein
VASPAAPGAPWDVLKALVDRILPRDADPSAWDAGAAEFLRRMLGSDLAARAADLWAGVAQLDREALAAGPARFAELGPARQDALLGELAAGGGRTPWPGLPAAAFLTWLAGLVAQGFYGDPGHGGNRGAASWRMVGYRQLAGEAAAPASDLPGPVITAAGLADSYDAVVVGAGAGGGAAAALLAEAGARVLLVERGRWLGSADLRPDHLRNGRSQFGYDVATELPPRGFPREVTGQAGPVLVTSADPRWGGNASTLGGGTRIYGAQAWRLCDEDFRMASVYGVPAGSSLADWPIRYADLAPWYDAVEWELGVSGDPAGNRFAGQRARPYPMPPLPGHAGDEVLQRGAERLGLSTSRVPMLINSVPRDGRAACVQCGACVGFACPTGAKAGTHNTLIRRATATGRCDVITGAHAARLTTTGTGQVNGVALTGLAPAGQWRHEVRAGYVLLAGGAVETARLLLNSPSAQEPHGLGNQHDGVGRHLQGHLYAGAVGIFDEIVQDSRGPGPSIATNDFRHHNPGLAGGGMIANDFVPTPVNAWHTLTGLGAIPRYGLAGKAGMRRAWPRMQMIFGPVQEVTARESRVRVDPGRRDRLGVPVAQLSGDLHPEDRRTASFLSGRAAAWLEASGARSVYPVDTAPATGGPSAGQHQAGTCRMGDDPGSSVVDPRGRLWGHDNVLVVDGSVHVTNGGVNPVLTILAMAYRTTAGLARGARP